MNYSDTTLNELEDIGNAIGEAQVLYIPAQPVPEMMAQL